MGEQKGHVNEGVKTIGTWNQGGGVEKMVSNGLNKR